MANIKCVSMFVDIGRGDWQSYERTTTKYINDFIQLYSNIKLDLTLFCNSRIKSLIEREIEKTENFKSKVKFINFDIKDLYCFSPKFIEQLRKIQSSNEMKNYSRRDRNAPEYNRPEYIACMLAKPEIIKLAKDIHEDKDSHYVWLDFGAAHLSTNSQYLEILKHKNLSLLEVATSKIIFYKRQDIELSDDPWYYANFNDNVITPGGFYIVPNNLVDHYQQEFKKTVQNYFLDKNIIDDDQTIMGVFAKVYNNICETRDSLKYKHISEGDWFPIFDILKEE